MKQGPRAGTRAEARLHGRREQSDPTLMNALLAVQSSQGECVRVCRRGAEQSNPRTTTENGAFAGKPMQR